MKIVRFSQNGYAPRLGCYIDQDQVMDLAASCTAFLAAQGVVRAAAIAAALFPQSTRGFLEGGSATQEMLAKMLEGLAADTFEPVTFPASTVRLHAPINDPGKFICIGLNYTDHAAETGKSGAAGAAHLSEMEHRHPRSRRAYSAATGRDAPRLGGGAGRGHRQDGALCLQRTGPRLRLRLHHHQRRQRP